MLLCLKNVLHVPQLSVNLISAHKLSRQLKCLVCFSEADCFLQDLTSLQKIGLAEEENGLYLVKKNKEKQRLSFSFHGIKQKGDPPDMWLWHRRLGHPSFEILRKVFPNLVSPSNVTKLHCDVCEIAKHHRVSYPSSENKTTLPFSIVHSDVWGPCRTTSLFGHRWFVTFIDEHTRHMWVYLMHDKSEVFSLFVTFYNMISNFFDTKIRILHSDQGREYVNNDFKKFFTKRALFTICRVFIPLHKMDLLKGKIVIFLM